jgi:hypothetical protein
MKRVALVAGLVLAFGAPAFAQDAPQSPPIAEQPALDEPADSTQAQSTLQVEPTHSTVAIMVPTVSTRQ